MYSVTERLINVVFRLIYFLWWQVDTLRLAIGYISFLAELVASDRHPADVLQTAVPEPPKKIFINSTKGKCPSEVFKNPLPKLERVMHLLYIQFGLK